MSEPVKKLLHFGRHKNTGSYYSQASPITWEMLEPCGQIEVDEGVWVLFSKEPLDEFENNIAALRAELDQVKKEREAYVKACDLWIETARQVGEKLQETEARAEKAEQFREAVIDALVVSCIYVEEHDTNPRKAINDLICWEQKIALDPLVSSDARALIERAVAGCAEDCAIQVAAREKVEQELATAQQENARLREALAWRPIETAPHHDWILLDCGNAGIVEGCYSTFEKEDAPRWFDSYGRTIYGPLHWIPLLDTPAARTALGDKQ